jgi:hypothetical protein
MSGPRFELSISRIRVIIVTFLSVHCGTFTVPFMLKAHPSIVEAPYGWLHQEIRNQRIQDLNRGLKTSCLDGFS